MNKKTNKINLLVLIIKFLFFPIMLLFSFFKIIYFGSTNKKTKVKQKYSEKELNKYGLWKDEKELVRMGEYDPWDFEENEMLEDSEFKD